MPDETEHDDEDQGQDHDHEEGPDEATAEVFLALRQQNLELLQIAAKVAGYLGEHPAVKPNDLRGALRTIWDVYSEFYAWIDPETAEDDEDGDEEEE